jgi:hypothetical protein
VRRAVAVLAVLAGLVVAGRAEACACCAEPGTWYQLTSPLRPDERAELAKLRFRTATVVQTPEGAGGFTSLAMKARLVGRVWVWEIGPFRARLTLPRSATALGADVHDGKMGGGGGPLLYKELRLVGPLRTAGMGKGTRYRLVLQGRGNNCLNAADFRSWHLDVLGGPKRYSLYGTFR